MKSSDFVNVLIEETLLSRKENYTISLLERYTSRLSYQDLCLKYNFNNTVHSVIKNINGFNRGCGCRYCLALYDYVQQKLILHRFTKQLDREWSMYNKTQYDNLIQRRLELEQTVRELQKAKNLIKKELRL